MNDRDASRHPLRRLAGSDARASHSQPTSGRSTPAPKAQAAAEDVRRRPSRRLTRSIAAAAAFDVAALESIFGPDGRDLAFTRRRRPGQEPRRRVRRQGPRAHSRHRRSDEREPRAPVGRQRRLAVPGADRQERRPGGRSTRRPGARRVLNRRIGGNELDAIELCRGYVEAQHEYALTKRDGSASTSTRSASSARQASRTAWRGRTRTARGAVRSAKASRARSTQGYSDKAEPYHGYFFKVLKGQGPAAPLGEMDFVIKGVMIGGFALVAAPAEYGVTGVQDLHRQSRRRRLREGPRRRDAERLQGDGAVQSRTRPGRRSQIASLILWDAASLMSRTSSNPPTGPVAVRAIK